jgi:hypothetical protein
VSSRKPPLIGVAERLTKDPLSSYRTIPGWIQHIFIRKVTDIAAVGLKEKNEPERFEKAFTDVPKSAWHLFEEPTECSEIIKAFLNEE